MPTETPMFRRDAGFVYEQVADELRGRIADGTYVPGQQLAPEAEMAAQFGTTRRTLRKALALLAAEGLLLRQKGRGTFVAETAVGETDESLVFYFGPYESHFFGELFTAVSRECQQASLRASAFDLTHGALSADAKRRLKIDLGRARGIICLTDAWDDLAPLLSEGAPPPVFVDFHSRGNDYPAPVISTDRFRAGMLAAAHLLDLGHRNIACIGTWPETDYDGAFPMPNSDNQVFEGYRAAVLLNDGSEIRGLGTYGGIDEPTIDKFCRYLDELGDWPTAFVCDADYLAVILTHALSRRNQRVPDDISIASVANTPWSRATPPGITSVYLGEREMARLAVDLCRKSAPAAAVRYRVEPTLILRRSTREVD